MTLDTAQKEIHHSTLLVTYNHEDYIKDALESILAQETMYTFEIVIVDDCSTDKTEDIIREYVQKYPDIIRYYRTEKNVGIARLAIFQLRPILRGKYWSILEGDDFLTNTKKIQKQIEFMEENPDYIGCTSGYTIFNVQENSKTDHFPSLNSWDITDMVSGQHALYSHTSTWVWRNVFKNINKDGFHFPDRLKEEYTFGDTCLCYFMANQGGKIYSFGETMSCYRMTGSGKWTSLSEEEQQRRNQELFQKIDKITDYKYSDKLKTKENIILKKDKFISILKNKTPWLYTLLKKIRRNNIAKTTMNLSIKVLMLILLKMKGIFPTMNKAYLKQKFPFLYKIYQSKRFSGLNKIAQTLSEPGVSNSANKFSGKVFCIGMGKTGTTSIEYALAGFGYNLVNQSRAEMLSKECYEGQFDRLFALCELHDGFQDAPFCFADFYKKLDERFPNSKFILTVRDSGEQWFSSLCRFHSKAYSSTDGLPTEQDLRNSRYGYLGMAYDNYSQFLDYPKTPLYDKEAYIKIYDDRNKEILEYFKNKPDKFIVLNVNDDNAYHELGKFLNVDIPEGKKFPHLNKT